MARSGRRSKRHTSTADGVAASFLGEGDIVPNSGRMAKLLVIFAAIALICIARLVYLQIIVAEEYSADAADSRTVPVETTPRRGTIYDRNGVVLACSVDATTVYANPKEITDPQGTAAIVAAVLGGTVADYQEVLETKDTTFVYVKRKADVAAAEKLASYELAGLYFIDDTRREYPWGEVAGQVVGFCNVDGEGISGLELYYNDVLSGTQGATEGQYGLSGTPIPGTDVTGTQVVDGTDIMISLDIEMQAYAEEMLKKYSEIWGVDTEVLLMDGSTGEIYAAASLPLFNPADTSEVVEGSTTVKSLVGSYEPGSIFKTVSALSLLTHKAMRVEEEIECPSSIEADEYTVSDAHYREDVTYTLREIIQYSSNVGISLAVEKMGFQPFYNDIVDWGLNDLTGIDYPGEPEGYLLDFDYWSKIQGYNITFGQGISVTPLQMVRFYGMLVNGGTQVTPHFLIALPETGTTVEYETVQKVTDQAAIDDTVSMLETVVEAGTAQAAAIDGYTVAGKTGTAEVASEDGGYKDGVYDISFVGFLPHSSSNLVCFTGSIELPADGTTTALFRDIMLYAIERYKIAAE
ncbi:MAG: penicillin-binding protein 2 [Coriobacteriia bacterium]|nr:penicillin-binding protein 2 [Coriobacteriia bacterium]